MLRFRFVLAALFAAAMLIEVAQAQDAAAIGRLVQLTGGVVVLRAGNPAPAALEDPVYAGDLLRTYKDGKVLVVLDGGVRVTLGPDSEIELAGLVPPQSGGRLDALFRLLDGIVRVLIREGQPAGSRVDVQTSAATASARATDFIVESAPERTSVLAVERRIEVTGRGGASVTLDPGEGTDVPEVPSVHARVRAQGFGPARDPLEGAATIPSAPRVWGAARRADALARTTL